MSLIKSTVLYIGDNFDNLETFRATFKNRYKIITLSSTKDVLNILKKYHVKVIISDLCMPDENGIDFFKRINRDYPHVIKIIITAYCNNDQTLKINDAVIYRFLSKPVNSTEVKETIDIAIREYNLRYEKNVLFLELQKKNAALYEAYLKIVANEKKFHAVFSNSNDGKYILTFEKEIVEVNHAFLKFINYKKLPLDLKKLNSFVREHFPKLIDMPVELARNTSNSISDIEISDGLEVKFLEINSNEIAYNRDKFILSILRDISERRLFEKKLVEAIVKTQEEEQNKYARELHDGLGPLLSTLKMHLEWIANPENIYNKDKIISNSISVIDNAIRSVKEIANNMSPHVLSRFGLVNAVSEYVEHIKESSDIDFYITSNFIERLSVNIELILYRTILECINNSIKHSEAKKIILKFNKRSNFLNIEYSDNGKGFDVNKEMSGGKGMGLFNIQSRIRHIDGEFNIRSEIGVGTTVNINIFNF